MILSSSTKRIFSASFVIVLNFICFAYNLPDTSSAEDRICPDLPVFPDF